MKRTSLLQLAGAETAPQNLTIFTDFHVLYDARCHRGCWHDVLRWMLRVVTRGGFGGWGGVNDVRCYLQTNMMFFGG